MAPISIKSAIFGLYLSLTSLVAAQAQIPLVCYDEGIMIIAVPGTNVPNGTYGLTQSFINNVQSRIPNSGTMSLNYNRFHNVSLASQFFLGEVTEGVPALEAALYNYTTACPNTPIVLHGYSEGGCVVMNALCGAASPWPTQTGPLASSYAKRVIAVILYGEETRIGGSSFNIGSCTSNAPRLGRSNIAACAAFAPVIQDYCLADDSNCCVTANASNPLGPEGIIWHNEYPFYFDDASASFIVSQQAKFVNSATTTAEFPTGVTPVGCFIDSPNRVLPQFMYSSSNNTAASCSLACRAAGYQYSGTEDAECYCGSIAPPESLYTDGCWKRCPGNSLQSCGNNWRINVYFDSLAVPISAKLPPGVSPVGCYTDSWSRTLSYGAYANSSNTNALCATVCSSESFIYSGTESDECWCGNTLSAALATSNTSCNANCPGFSGSICGGYWLLSVYQSTNVASTLPSGWTSQGCAIDSWNRVFQTEMWAASNNSDTTCLNACHAGGFAYAGTEAGDECWCGHNAPSSSLGAASSDCNEPCVADATQTCGGQWRLSTFQYTG